MYYDIIITLFIISTVWIFILTQLSEIMGKINAVSAGVIFTIVLLTFVSNGLIIYDNLNEIFGIYFGALLFVIVVILVIFLMIISTSFITKSLDYIIHKRAKHDVTVKLLKESKQCLGGYLIFDVKFTSWLFDGCFVIHLESPYLEEKQIRIQYNYIKKLGRLKGRYTNKKVQLRCNIPKDWGAGKYDVTVSIEDVCTWMFSLKKIMVLSSENFEIDIDESKI